MPARTVLQILNGEVFSGVEQALITICRHLDPARYRPHIVTLFEGLTAQRARNLGFAVDVVPMSSRWDLRVVKVIRQIARSQDAVILHAHTVRSHMVGAFAARSLHIPVVVHIQSPAIEESERGLKNRWNAFVESRLQKRTDRYVIVAHSLKRHLSKKGIPDQKIVVLYNAVDVEGVLERSPGLRPSIRERLGLGSEVKLIGMVAMFRDRKGAQDLLPAIKMLGDGPAPHHLVMIGAGEKLPNSGNYIDLLKQMTYDLGIGDCVTFVGFQENPLQWIRELDVFVLPSRFGEGLPLVILEAMALGVPVIATPVEGTPEAITDQVSGVLPPVENPRALADSIALLLADAELGKRLAQEASKVVRERFDAPVQALGMMEIYDELLR